MTMEMKAKMTDTAETLPTPPPRFVCPITNVAMKDPMLSRHGFHFEREAILRWLDEGHCYCPVSHKPLRPSNLVSDKNLGCKIKTWAKASGYRWPKQHSSAEPHAEVGGDGPVAGASASSSQQDQQQPIATPTNDEDSSSLSSSSIESNSDADDLPQTCGYVSFVPQRFVCPVTGRAMEDPVMARTGLNFERKAILDHMKTKGNYCPVTKKPLHPSGIVANCKLKQEIAQWNLHYGESPNSKSSFGKLFSANAPNQRGLHKAERNTSVRCDHDCGYGYGYSYGPIKASGNIHKDSVDDNVSGSESAPASNSNSKIDTNRYIGKEKTSGPSTKSLNLPRKPFVGATTGVQTTDPVSFFHADGTLVGVTNGQGDLSGVLDDVLKALRT